MKLQLLNMLVIVASLVVGSLNAQERRSGDLPPAGPAAGSRAAPGDPPRPAGGRSGALRIPNDGRREGQQFGPPDQRLPPGPGAGPAGDLPGRRPMSPDRRAGQRVQPPRPGIGPSPFEMQRLEQDDPEMHALVVEDNRLDRECLALSRQIREAKTSEREKLQAELTVVVNKHFDVRQKRRELSLQRLEDELKRLREAIESRNVGREEIVQKRLAELIGSNKDLDF